MTTSAEPDSPSGTDVAVLRARVAARPDDPAARYDLAAALWRGGDARAAAPVFLKASRLAPAWLAPRLMLARCLGAAGREADALSVLSQTTADFPDATEGWMQRGTLERRQGLQTQAEASFRRVTLLAPADASGWNNLGVALRAQGRLPEAEAAYERALALQPASALAHANLGNALDAAGRPAEAEAHLRAAVALEPHSFDARYNLAVHLAREEKPADAIAMLRDIVAARPDHWQAWINLGVALLAVGDTAGAEQAYRQALALHPSAPEAHYNLAWVLLLTGQWREGWAEYEWRWRLPTFTSAARPSGTPAWDGTASPGATLLLQAEQGHGDTIQFVQLARLARQRVGRVILECPEGLVGVLRGLSWLDDVVPLGRAVNHDVHAPLMSLPRLLDIRPDNLPGGDAYIPRPEAPARLTLPASRRARIGVVWAGSPDNKIDRRRSCDVRHVRALMEAADADFVSLQAGPRAADLSGPPANLVFDINGKVSDWTDTAAVLGQLDLIIGVDTAVLHLAGAMGLPAWLLLPSSPDFRWLLGRNDTPWYMSVRLFRQPARGDWTALFGNVRTALTVWLQARS